MNRISVEIIDGTASEESLQSSPLPDFVTRAEHRDVMMALMDREPLFHREAWGIDRETHERMTEPGFWEVGASGRRYSREFIIESLEKRYENPIRGTWHIEDFQCQEIAADNYLVTYTLFQGARQSRRSTIWRRSEGEWKVVYHQGTLVE